MWVLVQILLVILLSSHSLELEFSVAYNFMNTSGSSAIFQPWMAARSGAIKFNFKTFDSDGLLFYIGDNNDPNRAGNFMYLKLEWGTAVLVTQVHYFTHSHEENKIEERISLSRNLNDGNWHGINIERKGSYTILKVDKKTTTLQLADKISNLRIASYLYLGGIPRRFLGCIKDLGYGEGTYIGPPRMVRAEYVEQREICLDACQPKNKCINGGICRNNFIDYECDCRGTGYEGKYCETPSILLTLDGLGYLEHHRRSVSNSTDIVVGLKTRTREGIIFGVGDRDSYAVIEILQERVGVSVKLNTGVKQTVIMNSYKINDDKWHFVRVTRRGQEVRIQLDKRFEEKLFLDATDENNAILNSVHLGGAWNTAKIFPGFTQTKFCGCLTQVYYNEGQFVAYRAIARYHIGSTEYDDVILKMNLFKIDILRNGVYKGSARRMDVCIESQCIRK